MEEIKFKQNEVFRRINNFVMSDAILNFFDNSSDLFTVANYSDKFVAVNRAFTNELGWTFEELTGTTFFNFIHDENVDFVKKILKEKKEDFYSYMKCKNGTIKKIRWKVKYDNEKEYIYATGRVIPNIVSEATDIMLEKLKSNNNEN